MSVLLDTNILLRIVDRTSSQSVAARAAVTRLARDGTELHFYTQNPIEFWAVATRPRVNRGLGLSHPQADVRIDRFSRRLDFIPDPPDVFMRWRQLVTTRDVSGKPAHDAPLAATALAAGIPQILTFDSGGFGRYAADGLTVIDPRSLAERDTRRGFPPVEPVAARAGSQDNRADQSPPPAAVMPEPTTAPRKRPVVLIVRDGWGHNPRADQDAVDATVRADTPVNDRLLAEYPHVQIATSGEDVGLPDGVMGNSEVGHQNLGAGRIVDQELMRITRAVRDGRFYENERFAAAIEHARANGGVVHLVGLLSDGGVHSHIDHALALVDLCRRKGVPADGLAVHAITDGRDTSPTAGVQYVGRMEEKLESAGYPPVADVIGRFFAMDRDFRWDRVRQAYDLWAGRGPFSPDKVGATADSVTAALEAHYKTPADPNAVGDEFVPATRVTPGDGVERIRHGGRIADGDAVIVFNYRGDRPREIVKAFVLPDEEWAAIKGGGFDREPRPRNLYFCGMTRYESGLPIEVAFEKPPKMAGILGDVVSSVGEKQFRCAESEKHPHVTYFFNDYREVPFGGELQKEVPSPREVSTYDQKPEMSAAGVTEEVLKAIEGGEYGFILVNYANGDMVGHTGSLEAAVRAVEVVDDAVGKITEAVLERGGALVITADHGNCEQMVDPDTGRPHTAHTTYDVDLIVVDAALKNSGAKLRGGGRLADVAPTVLGLMGLERPGEMTGDSLLN